MEHLRKRALRVLDHLKIAGAAAGGHRGEYRDGRLPQMTWTHRSPTFHAVTTHPDLDPRYRGSWPALTVALALRALVAPRLALDLLKTAWAFRRQGWLHRAPFLPIPDRTYLRWRMYTAYGDEAAVPPVEDVIRFARWRRETMGL